MMWRSLLLLLTGITGPALAAPLVAPVPATPVPAHALPHLADLAASAPDADPKVLGRALQAMQCAAESGMPASQRLAVIDYSLPSSRPRLWVFDLASGQLLFHELVAHGRNTGDNEAHFFSNEMNSRSSSIGLFRTLDTYEGGNGYSLRLQGLEPGFNDHAYERSIVMHGAPYVNEEHVKKFGRLGRSWGCPAVRMGVAKRIIDSMKGGQFVFSYYPDSHWLSASQYLNCGSRTASL
ncbi:MAG TPA: murein L,D-transpeptidase catalytic domain family protein [Moraxellaceae bacterium]|nr:murein L,D-transpeptidase catalytic domain family protein [Moraxellaceae bacterium]